MVKQENEFKIEIKDKIILATTQLIQEHGEISKITVRDIAARANVGVGLINYHFQTKDNLINLCTLELIRHSIEQLGSMTQNMEMTPIDQMKTLGRGIMTFMVINPGISKVSITKDFVSPDVTDNSVQVVKMFAPIAKKICDNCKSDLEIHQLLHMLVFTIEAAFLRKNVLKEVFEIDIENMEQRDRLVDFYIDQLFSK